VNQCFGHWPLCWAACIYRPSLWGVDIVSFPSVFWLFVVSLSMFTVTVPSVFCGTEGGFGVSSIPVSCVKSAGLVLAGDEILRFAEQLKARCLCIALSEWGGRSVYMGTPDIRGFSRYNYSTWGFDHRTLQGLYVPPLADERECAFEI
jgi:hypothetical protein